MLKRCWVSSHYLWLALGGLGLILLLAGALWVHTARAAGPVPTISISSVAADQTVTIHGVNFPANQQFRVMMGVIGSRGIGGIQVATTNSGSGAFTATYDIPDSLKGSRQIAIRLESAAGYYSYNWFHNATAPAPAPPPARPAQAVIPTFSITEVVADQTVTIRTANFPANQQFRVTMGPMGTRGIGGTPVTTTDSGTGGSFTATYEIPEALRDSYWLAIRLESAAGYYSYNWFYNRSTAVAPAPATPASPATPPATVQPAPVHRGIPVFSITAVTRDQTVTIRASNFPPNREFRVLMGRMGTRGIGGAVVATTNSGDGAFTATYNIPEHLRGSYQIAIRLQGESGYHSYNWFYNNTTR